MAQYPPDRALYILRKLGLNEGQGHVELRGFGINGGLSHEDVDGIADIKRFARSGPVPYSSRKKGIAPPVRLNGPIKFPEKPDGSVDRIEAKVHTWQEPCSFNPIQYARTIGARPNQAVRAPRRRR